MWSFNLFGRSGRRAEVSSNGEVLTRAFAYSDPIFKDMDAINTAYNFFIPRAGEQLVITDIVAFADRDVTTQTQLDIYEATSLTSITIGKQIMRLDIAKLAESAHHGLHFLINQGAFVNAKHGDDDVFLTIAGYYVPQIGLGDVVT